MKLRSKEGKKSVRQAQESTGIIMEKKINFVLNAQKDMFPDF